MESRFVGAIVGQAVGDALGFPFEGLPPEITSLAMAERPEVFRRHASGFFPAGQYTDDTQMMRAILESLVSCNGRVDPAHIAAAFAELWRTGAIVGSGTTCSEVAARLLAGVEWSKAGVDAPRAGNGSAMRTCPVGLLHWDDPPALIADAELISSITHRDPRCLAGAAAVSAAVAFNVRCSGDFDHVAFLSEVRAAAWHSSPELAFAIDNMPEWLERIHEREVMREIAVTGLRQAPAEDESLGITPFVVPTVLYALYAFLRSPYDYMATARLAISAGGDVDTTAAIAGALSGAFNGIEAVPESLSRAVNDRGDYGYDYLRGLAVELYRLATNGL
jgi:ADP-ribosylglycohydrolase